MFLFRGEVIIFGLQRVELSSGHYRGIEEHVLPLRVEEVPSQKPA